MRRFASICFFVAVGTAVATAEITPADALPAQWCISDSLLTDTADADNARWWQAFGDVTLDSLVTLARHNNYDAAAARARIDMARAAVGSARAAYYPNLGLSASYARERTAGESYNVFSGTVTMSWEVDVFGKITAQVRQQRAQVRLSAAEYGAVMTSLEAEVASTYVGLLSARAQLAVARTHTASQEHIVQTTEGRFESGLASKLDVAQARTLYYSTIASIPMLEAQIEAAVNALAVLTAVPRGELPQGVFSADTLPDYRNIVATGVPADILRRRPDIVEAERRVDIAGSALGIARKEYLPSLTIQGSIGTTSHRAGDLFTSPSFTYSIAPTLSWTIFDGLSRHYAAVEARENLRAAVDSYNMAVLNAVREVNDAITRYGSTTEYIALTRQVVENAAESVRLSVDLYRQGLTAFTNVDDAELNYLTYENSLVTAKAQAINALIDLYKALGGGWQQDQTL